MTAHCLNPAGDYRRVNATVNVGANTIDNWVKGAAMTLPAGVWLLTASAHIPSGGSGTRNCGCCIFNGSTNWEQQRVYLAANVWTSLTPCTTVSLSAPTEVSVRVGLSSAANKVSTFLNAARIA